MNEEVSVDNLADGCSDHGELITKIEAAIHLGDKVVKRNRPTMLPERIKKRVFFLSVKVLQGEENAIKHLVILNTALSL